MGLAYILRRTGLSHPLHFAVTHIKIRLHPPKKLIRPGKIIRQLLFSLLRFAMHHRRLVRSLIAEIEIVARFAETGRLIARETTSWRSSRSSSRTRTTRAGR